MKAKTTYDQRHDVLYAKLEGATVHASREHPLDGNVIMNLDQERRIVGVQILSVSELVGMWDVHPVRHSLPGVMCAEIKRFMQWLEAGPQTPDANVCRRVPPEWVLQATPEA